MFTASGFQCFGKEGRIGVECPAVKVKSESNETGKEILNVFSNKIFTRYLFLGER
jgi:hypothetical protein